MADQPLKVVLEVTVAAPDVEFTSIMGWLDELRDKGAEMGTVTKAIATGFPSEVDFS